MMVAPEAQKRLVSHRTEAMLRRYFHPDDHPYSILENEVSRRLRPADTLLDAGCSRSAPVLRRFVGKARRLVGVDVVEFSSEARQGGIELIHGDLSNFSLPDNSVDGIVSRSVLEHVNDPLAVYRELARVLKTGGWVVFLTPNLWDYASLAARVIPNQFHPALVARTEGRAEEDTFPAYYRSNTQGAVQRLAKNSGFEVLSCRHLTQYPNYLMFSAPLFFLGTCYTKLIGRFDVLKHLRGWLLVTIVKK